MLGTAAISGVILFIIVRSTTFSQVLSFSGATMQLGLLTPPFWMLLFTMRGVAPKHITMPQIFRAVTPYVLMGLLMLVLVLLVPGLATWLPKVLLG